MMKLYPNLNVSLAFQNCGEKWVMLLEGAQEHIELAFNSLFNFGATNGELEYLDDDKTLARFWSRERKMFSYFTTRFFFLPAQDFKQYKGKKRGCLPEAQAYARKMMAELRKHTVTMFDFHAVGVEYNPYGQGTMTAERPDYDFRDSVILDGMTEKSIDANPE